MNSVILIAESGSTKTDWVLIEGDTRKQHQTIGLNPFIVTSSEIENVLSQDSFFQQLSELELVVHFYGSGCSTEKRNAVVSTALSKLLPNAEINIYHDVDAAVHATTNNEKGIVAILGTGSNCVYFDGESINYGNPSPGYLLGDEGGGSHIGKTFIRDVLYEVAPSILIKAFYDRTGLDKKSLIDSVYSAEMPNAYLASHVSFLGEYSDQDYVKELIYKCFSKFVRYHVVQFPEAADAPIHLVGSIGFYFQDVMSEVLEKWKIDLGVVTKSPLEGLIQYHASV